MHFDKPKKHIELILAVVASFFSAILLFSWCTAFAVPADYTIHFTEQYQMVITQVIACLVGVICFWLLQRLSLRSPLLKIAAFFLLILFFLTFLRTGPFGVGPEATDAFCWIVLPFNMTLQPAELLKGIFVLSFSAHLAWTKRGNSHPLSIMLLLMHLIFPSILIHLQGDDGTALLYLLTGIAMFLYCYHRPAQLVAIFTAGAAGLIFLWKFILRGYQYYRILALYAPDRLSQELLHTFLYQQQQALSAQDIGGLFGLGLFNDALIYIPEGNNDFIFSYASEVTGFLGAIAIIILLIALLSKLFWNIRTAASLRSKCLCTGIFALFLIQSFINLGMNLMLTPVIGVPLPFFSSGGSAMLSAFFCLSLSGSACANVNNI